MAATRKKYFSNLAPSGFRTYPYFVLHISQWKIHRTLGTDDIFTRLRNHETIYFTEHSHVKLTRWISMITLIVCQVHQLFVHLKRKLILWTTSITSLKSSISISTWTVSIKLSRFHIFLWDIIMIKKFSLQINFVVIIIQVRGHINEGLGYFQFQKLTTQESTVVEPLQWEWLISIVQHTY